MNRERIKKAYFTVKPSQIFLRFSFHSLLRPRIPLCHCISKICQFTFCELSKHDQHLIHKFVWQGQGWAGLTFGFWERERERLSPFPNLIRGERKIVGKLHSQILWMGTGMKNSIPNGNEKNNSQFMGKGMGGRYSRECSGKGIPVASSLPSKISWAFDVEVKALFWWCYSSAHCDNYALHFTHLWQLCPFPATN